MTKWMVHTWLYVWYGWLGRGGGGTLLHTQWHRYTHVVLVLHSIIVHISKQCRHPAHNWIWNSSLEEFLSNCWEQTFTRSNLLCNHLQSTPHTCLGHRPNLKTWEASYWPPSNKLDTTYPSGFPQETWRHSPPAVGHKAAATAKLHLT